MKTVKIKTDDRSPDEMYCQFYDCPNCDEHYEIPEEANYCPNCGVKIKWI